MRRTLLVSILVAAGVAGCSTAGDEPEGLSTATPTETPTQGDNKSADVAEIEQLWADFWTALISSENGPDPDPALFDGIAEGSVIENQVHRVETMIAEKQQRVGEPKVGEPKITVNGKKARVEACVDQNPWRVEIDGEKVPAPNVEVVPNVFALKLTSDGWRIVEQLPSKEGTLKC